MNDTLTRKQAIADCKVLWKEMAITGSSNKTTIIHQLHKRGLVSQRSYKYQCPLCELYNDMQKGVGECPGCPWPGKNGNRKVRCEMSPSPYMAWKALQIIGKENKQNQRQKAASQVLKLIKTFKIERDAKSVEGLEFIFHFNNGDTLPCYVKRYDPKIGLTCISLDTKTANGWSPRIGHPALEEDGTFCVIAIDVTSTDYIKPPQKIIDYYLDSIQKHSIVKSLRSENDLHGSDDISCAFSK